MTIQLHIVTPEELGLSKRVPLVTIPGEMGDMGVMPGHAPVLTTLRPGMVTIHREDESVETRFFVFGGFAEITPERVTVLAERTVDLTSRPDRSTFEGELAARRKDREKHIQRGSDSAILIQHDKDVAALEHLIEHL